MDNALVAREYYGGEGLKKVRIIRYCLVFVIYCSTRSSVERVADGDRTQLFEPVLQCRPTYLGN